MNVNTAETIKMASIKDVAKQAGVSVATVSRVINSPAKVSPNTLKSVTEAIEALNYHPNTLARDFRKKSAFRIIVLVPNISNPFFSHVIHGVQSKAKDLGYSVLLGETHKDSGIESEYARMVLSKQADGIIQLSPSDPFQSLKSVGSNPEKMWVNACEHSDNPNTSLVGIDNASAMQELTQLVLNKGHTQIGVLLGPKDSPLTRSRRMGIERAINTKHDIKIVEVDGDFSAQSGLAAASKFLKINTRPTAIICFNDEMAIGLMHGLKTSRISIPDDISITGFDDLEFAQFCDPPLTTVRQPSHRIGEVSMLQLHSQLQSPRPIAETKLLEFEMIERSSLIQRKI